MVMNAMSVMKKTKQQLHESGFKLTPQREATLQVLLENEKEQFGKDLVLMKETLVEKQSENEKILERVRMLSSEIERI